VSAPILVTGVAGFIGYHVARRLLEAGQAVVGLDNLNDYYSQQLKRDRLELLRERGLDFRPVDLVARAELQALLGEGFARVIHLAAQPGVRYSLVNPYAYLDSNLTGFVNLMEACRTTGVEHVVYASSSSVYGGNRELPFSTGQAVDHPLSLYAATKRANELLAHTYAATFGLPVTGLRFFTVYGPWGRPDMAVLSFARAIATGQPITLFNDGDLRRDFTYVDDIVDGVLAAAARVPAADPGWQGPATSFAPYRLYNLGAHAPVEITYFVELLERELGRAAVKRSEPLPPGDVPATFADVDDSRNDLGFEPRVSIEEGLRRTMDWYKEYRQGNPEV